MVTDEAEDVVVRPARRPLSPPAFVCLGDDGFGGQYTVPVRGTESSYRSSLDLQGGSVGVGVHSTENKVYGTGHTVNGPVYGVS